MAKHDSLDIAYLGRPFANLFGEGTLDVAYRATPFCYVYVTNSTTLPSAGLETYGGNIPLEVGSLAVSAGSGQLRYSGSITEEIISSRPDTFSGTIIYSGTPGKVYIRADNWWAADVITVEWKPFTIVMCGLDTSVVVEHPASFY